MIKNGFLAIATVKYKMSINRRNGIIKNGSCIVSWHGIKLGELYALVDTNGYVVAVNKKGIFANKLMANMKSYLMFKLRESEENEKHPRRLLWNEIDTPLREIWR